MVPPITLTIDVSEAAGLVGPLHTAASVFLPPSDSLSSPPVVVFAFPGGGYGRGYYSFDMPGSSCGGQAGYHVANQGWIFVACDHLGAGESSQPDRATLTVEAVTAANRATVEHIMARLQDGTLDDSVGPVDGAVRIGLGQSLGGFYVIAMQGCHSTFDGIAILGWSAIHTTASRPEGQRAAGSAAKLTQSDPTFGDDVDFIEALREQSRQEGWGRGFHHVDVPQQIVDADLIDYPTRRGEMPAWGSGTFPGTASTMLATLMPGAVAKEAAAVTVPVFIGAGEIDLLPDPRAEPAAYSSAADISLVVIPRMAHMHNFAGTRTVMWDRIAAWGCALRPRSGRATS